MPDPTPRKIFISYRRADHGEFVERIRDWLINRYGRDNVFMDFDSIPPFVTFEEFIEERITAADAVIVIIGPRWVELMRERTESGEDDYVLFELVTALKLNKVIAPILIKNGAMPAASDLREDLRPLRKINAPSLDSGKAFLDNIGHIIDGIEGALARREQKAPSSTDSPASKQTQLSPSPSKALADTPRIVSVDEFGNEPFIPIGSSEAPPAVLPRTEIDSGESLFAEPPTLADDTRPTDAFSASSEVPADLTDIQVAIILKRLQDLDKQNDYSGMIKAATEALKVHGSYTDLYDRRGYAYMQLGNYDEAIADFTEGIRLDPYDLRFYQWRANTLESKNDFTAAIADFTRGIELGGQWLYQNRAYAKEKAGDYAGAIEDINECIRQHPHDFFYYNRADMHNAAGDLQAALDDYQKYISMNRFKNADYKSDAQAKIREIKQKLGKR